MRERKLYSNVLLNANTPLCHQGYSSSPSLLFVLKLTNQFTEKSSEENTLLGTNIYTHLEYKFTNFFKKIKMLPLHIKIIFSVQSGFKKLKSYFTLNNLSLTLG